MFKKIELHWFIFPQVYSQLLVSRMRLVVCSCYQTHVRIHCSKNLSVIWKSVLWTKYGFLILGKAMIYRIFPPFWWFTKTVLFWNFSEVLLLLEKNINRTSFSWNFSVSSFQILITCSEERKFITYLLGPKEAVLKTLGNVLYSKRSTVNFISHKSRAITRFYLLMCLLLVMRKSKDLKSYT